MYNELYGKLVNGSIDELAIGNKFDVYVNEVGEHPTNEQLSAYDIPSNYVEIINTYEKPTVDRYEAFVIQPLALIDGKWTYHYAVSKLDDETIAKIEAENGNRVLLERLKVLKDSDWTQLPDSPLSSEKKTEWATYRQAWRDITTVENYPFCQYPQKPA